MASQTSYKTLTADELKVTKHELDVPSLTDLAKVLATGLKSNFKDVEVNVVDCPDLTQKPFELAAPGICGDEKLLDVGGPPFLTPLPQKDRIYDMKDYPKLAEMNQNDTFLLGAGAAPWTYLNRCAEAMPNILLRKDGSWLQKTQIAYTVDADDSYKIATLPQNETTMSLMGNYFASRGIQGKVLEIKCKVRTGKENFVTCMRKTLGKEFEGKTIALGGTFLVKSGKLKIHVMPQFSECPLETNEQVEKWLKFYEMSSPFVCLSEFVSNDPGLDLRVEHSHGYSEHGDGGHYHYDTTPETVEYLAYYNVAKTLYRIDQP